MNSDFEKQISQQPVKPLPPGWKDGILRAARDAVKSDPLPVPTALGGMRAWLRELLWPSPVAWGALAAVWVIVLAVGGFSRNDGNRPPNVSLSSGQLQLVRQQQNLLRQELGVEDLAAVPPGRFVPGAGFGPRSDAPANNTLQQGADLHPRRETNLTMI